MTKYVGRGVIAECEAIRIQVQIAERSVFGIPETGVAEILRNMGQGSSPQLPNTKYRKSSRRVLEGWKKPSGGRAWEMAGATHGNAMRLYYSSGLRNRASKWLHVANNVMVGSLSDHI